MSLKEKATRGGLWFAAISFATQAVSWVFTFYVIRLLDPQDYGLMTMAAFLTAYLQMFSGLGLGSAIVQRENITDGEVHSVFWFALAVGVGMAAIAFLLAHPTAWLFKEERVIPITQLVGMLFIVSALTIVPYNLLSRQFEFKKIAIVNLVAVLVSSTLSLWMAKNHYGVYTLIWTNIALNGIKMMLLFPMSGWWPRMHYSPQEVRPYLSYGIYLALSSASLRLFQAVDKLVVGRIFGSTQLGLYDNAMTVSNMPLEKIWPIYQQVSFPLFSRLQSQLTECYETYLGIARHYLLVVGPIYLGCIVVAPELIRVVLGEKWFPMAPMLQVFCFVKLFEVLTAYHTTLFNAIGRHRNVFWFFAALVVIIPVGVFIAAQYSFAAVMLPWLFVYPVLCCAWLFYGLRSAALPIAPYIGAIAEGLKPSLVMFLVLVSVRKLGFLNSIQSDLTRLVILILLGMGVFGFVLLVFQRKLVSEAVRTLVGAKA